jgi:hypothetical protein
MNLEPINPNFDRAITDYYKQLDSYSISIEDFTLWIDSLQEPMKGHFKAKGIDNCRGVLSLQRFILELRDISLENFLKDRLTAEEFKAYKEALLP